MSERKTVERVRLVGGPLDGHTVPLHAVMTSLVVEGEKYTRDVDDPTMLRYVGRD